MVKMEVKPEKEQKPQIQHKIVLEYKLNNFSIEDNIEKHKKFIHIRSYQW